MTEGQEGGFTTAESGGIKITSKEGRKPLKPDDLSHFADFVKAVKKAEEGGKQMEAAEEGRKMAEEAFNKAKDKVEQAKNK